MQRLKRLLSAVLLASIGLFAPGAASAEEARFPTPEDAITAYIEGIAAQDFKAIYAATAVDAMTKGFDFVAYVDRLGALTPVIPAPATDPFLANLNRARFTAHIAAQLQFLVYGLMTRSEIIEGKSVRMDAEGATAFAASVGASRLSGIVLIKIGMPSPSLMTSERYLANAARMAATYGADDATERLALITFEGSHYAVGFSLLRFGTEWLVNTQSSPIAGTDSFGVPVPTTPEAFEGYLD